MVLLALGVFIYFVLTTLTNEWLYGKDMLKDQLVFLVVYFQNLLVFIIAYALFDKISIHYFLKLFLLIMFLAVVRVILEEPESLFKFSVVFEERIQALFIGGVNNYALLLGIAFIISFFYIENRILRFVLCAFWLISAVLTMSRGALLAIAITLFAVALYDTNRKTLKTLIRFSAIVFVIGAFTLFYFVELDEVTKQLNERFLSVFTGESKVDQFSSGRDLIWRDMFERVGESPFFNFLFGHGAGSIDFRVHGGHYKSSHNILIDLLFRNGVFVLFGYILFLLTIFLLFINRRDREKLPLFGVFVFLHVELMVNPFVFAAQMGWVYSIFMIIFIKQNKLIVSNQNTIT